MATSRQIFRWVVITGIALLVLAASFLFLLPKLLELKPIKDRAELALSQRINGEVRIGSLELQFVPRPQIALHQIEVYTQEESEGNVETLMLYPRLWDLFIGRFSFKEIRAIRPEFLIEFSSNGAKIGKGSQDFPLRNVQTRVRDALTRLAPVWHDMHLEVRNGGLEVERDHRKLAWFRGINGNIRAGLDRLDIGLVSRSSLWKEGAVRAKLRTGDFEGRVRIALHGFRPHESARMLVKTSSPYRMNDSAMDLNLDLNLAASGDVEAHAQSSNLYIALSRDKHVLTIKGKGLDGQFVMKEESIRASIKELFLESPRLSLSGDFHMDRGSQQMNLELQGKAVEVASVKQALLTLFRPGLNVGKVFDMIRGGEILEMKIHSHGRTLNDLWDTDNMRFDGRIQDGEILIPGIGFNLVKVDGTARISNGVLEAEDLEGSFGNSRGYEGKLRLGIKGATPLNLDIGVDADLSQVVRVLGNILQAGPLKSELKLLEGLEGMAKGRLFLGVRGSGLDIETEVTSFTLSCNYVRCPYPIRVLDGRLRLSKGHLLAENIHGLIGSSSFRGLRLRAGLAERNMSFALEHAEVNAQEILPWIHTFKGIRGALRELGASRGGKILLAEVAVEGPLFEPALWKFTSEGEIKGLSITPKSAAGPVKILEARFKATGGPRTRKGFVQDARVEYMDATFMTSGIFTMHPRELQGIDMEMEGEMGGAFLEWLNGRISMPGMPKLRSPISLSTGRLRWEHGLKTHFTAELQFAHGPHALVDLFHEPKTGLKHKLHIRDGDNQTSISFGLDASSKAIDLAFEGRLSAQTIRNTLVIREPIAGLLEGNMRARILKGQLSRSIFHGFLTAENVVVPFVSNIFPVNRIEKLRIESSGDNTLMLLPAVFTLDGQEVELQGDVGLLNQGLSLDVDLSAKLLDIMKVRRFLRMGDGEREKQGPSGLKYFPLKGAIRCRADVLAFKGFRWSPFVADLHISEEGGHITVQEAELCGVSMPGDVEFKEGRITLNLRINAKDGELIEVVSCLSNKAPLATGNFSVQGALTGQGSEGQLIQSFHGNLVFDARNGIIKRHIPLQTLLTYLNLTELFKGKLPDLGERGLPYNFMKSKMRIKGSTFYIQEGIIDAPSMEIFVEGKTDLLNKALDFTLIVSPLRTVDTVLKNIPIVGYITGGSLVSMAFKVEGAWDRPKVSPLPASAVGAGLVGMVKRTLKLPVKIIEPVLNLENNRQGPK